jgi:hypothetical protein
MRPVNITQVLIGGAALAVGLFVYLMARSPEQVYFLSRLGVPDSIYRSLPPLFGSLGGSLPSFLHVFAFILMTGGILGCRKTGSLVVALSWLITECAFEIGQKFPNWSEALVPRWFDSFPILDNTRSFFRTGTFDPLDMVAAVVGAMVAYFSLLATMERRVS